MVVVPIKMNHTGERACFKYFVITTFKSNLFTLQNRNQKPCLLNTFIQSFIQYYLLIGRYYGQVLYQRLSDLLKVTQ